MSRRFWGSVALIGAVAALVLAGLLWWDISTMRGTGDITSEIQDTYSGDAVVDCPPFIRWKVGKTFDCTITEGTDVDLHGITVTIRDSGSAVTWEAN